MLRPNPMATWRSSANRGTYQVGHTQKPSGPGWLAQLKVLGLIVAIFSGLAAGAYYAHELARFGKKYLDEYIAYVAARTVNSQQHNTDQNMGANGAHLQAQAAIQPDKVSSVSPTQGQTVAPQASSPGSDARAPLDRAAGPTRSVPRERLALPAYATTPRVSQHWLDGMHYVISPSERETFLALDTDAERARFVEEFWKRHDRGEYYRRLAFANREFGRTGLAGWETGPGHAYIAYGYPSYRNSRLPIQTSASSASIPVLTKWQYDFIEGLGANVTVEFDENNAEIFHVLSGTNDRW